MKKSVIAIFLMVITAIGAKAQYQLFSSLEERNDVEITYVSKSLLSMVKNQLYIGEKSIAGQIKNINSITVVESDTRDGYQACRNAFNTEVKNLPGVELVMRNKSENDETVIFGIPSKNNSDAYSCIVIGDFCGDKGDEDASIVVIEGEISIPSDDPAPATDENKQK